MMDGGELRGALAAAAVFLALMLLLLRYATPSTILRRITLHWRAQRRSHALALIAALALLGYVLVAL